MATMTDHWEGENVLITFEEEGKDSAYNMEGLIQNMGISGGASNTDEVYLFGSKTINFQKPREKFQIQVEGIFSKTEFDRIGFGDNTGDAGALGATEGKELRSGGTLVVQRRWRVIFWFLPSEGMHKTGNIVVPTKGAYAIYRIVCADCKAITWDTEMAADDIMKGTLTLEFSATDDGGYANMFKEYTSSQTATALTVLNATAHKGLLTWNTTTPAWTASYRT